MKPHKHAELIKAWADGAEIEFWSTLDRKWYQTDKPSWDENKKYRIKSTKKKTVVRWLWAYQIANGLWNIGSNLQTQEEAEENYPKESLIRLDWSRTEFEE